MKRVLLPIFFILLAVGLHAFEQQGLASWYGGEFQGRTTANGETFDTHLMTAAHKTLPFNTVVTVTNLSNQRSIEVRINDRGPYISNRIIDLSFAAAEALDIVENGTAPVLLTAEEGVESVLLSLQTGAFSSQENAERMLSTLMDAGFHPVTETADSGIIRILIPGIHEESIDSVRSQLRRLGILNTLIRENMEISQTYPVEDEPLPMVCEAQEEPEITEESENSEAEQYIEVDELLRILRSLKSGESVEIASSEAPVVGSIPGTDFHPEETIEAAEPVPNNAPAPLPVLPQLNTRTLDPETMETEEDRIEFEDEGVETTENTVVAPRPPALPGLSGTANSAPVILPEIFRERRSSAPESRGNGTQTAPTFD